MLAARGARSIPRTTADCTVARSLIERSLDGCRTILCHLGASSRDAELATSHRDVQRQRVRRELREHLEMATHGADVAAQQRAGQCGVDAETLGVGECLAREWP